jgi:hypothetical protein
VNPQLVIHRENELLAGNPGPAPHGDAEFMRALVLLNPESVAPLSAQGLFTTLKDDRLARRADGLADTFIAQITQLRGQFETTPALQAAVRSVPQGSQIQRGTRLILRELVRPLVADQCRRVSRQDALDLFHAVVPVAYCDIVLLDKHWASQVAHVQARLAAAAVEVQMARVFTRGRKGIEECLAWIEAGLA